MVKIGQSVILGEGAGIDESGILFSESCTIAFIVDTLFINMQYIGWYHFIYANSLVQRYQIQATPQRCVTMLVPPEYILN